MGDEGGRVVIALTQVPSDVQCLSVTATGSRTVVQRFPVTAGHAATFAMNGLPLGAVGFLGEAFASACGALGATSVPDWSSDPVAIIIERGVVARVNFIMRRNGRALINVDFTDDPAACDAAGLICLSARLDGTQSVPPIPTTATGTMSLVFDPVAHLVFYRLQHGVGGATLAHIHQGEPGVNGPPLFPLPLTGNLTGTIMTSAIPEADLLAGNLYVNVHSALYSDGEIRGQIRRINMGGGAGSGGADSGGAGSGGAGSGGAGSGGAGGAAGGTSGGAQALIVTPAALSLGEGQSTTFTLALALNPITPATINVFSQHPAKLEVTPPVLVFTSGTFGVPQTVTVRAFEDDDLVNEGSASTSPSKITVLGLSAGAASVEVAVSEIDNDTQAILLTPTTSFGSPWVIQESSTTQLGARLAFRPAGNVTVTLSTQDHARLGLAGGGTTALTFAPSNFSMTQFVTLTTPRDTDMVDDDITIVASATGVADAVQYVRVVDTDVLNFAISAPALGPIPEGSSASFVVKLTIAPAAPVTPILTSNHPSVSAAFLSGCTLSAVNFTSGCTVAVTAIEDANALSESATITIADGPGSIDPDPMRPIASRTVSVSVDDND